MSAPFIARFGGRCPACESGIMCSTGMTRQTVGMVCQLCGTNYGRGGAS